MAQTTLKQIIDELRLNNVTMKSANEPGLLTYAVNAMEQLSIAYVSGDKDALLDVDTTNNTAPLPEDFLQLVKVGAWDERCKRILTLSHDPKLIGVSGIANQSPCACATPTAAETDTCCSGCGGWIGAGSGWTYGAYGWGWAGPALGFGSYGKGEYFDPTYGRQYSGVADTNPFGYYNIMQGFIQLQRCNWQNHYKLVIQYKNLPQFTSDEQEVSIYAKEAIKSYIRYCFAQDNSNGLTKAQGGEILRLEAVWKEQKLAYMTKSAWQYSDMNAVFRTVLNNWASSKV